MKKVLLIVFLTAYMMICQTGLHSVKASEVEVLISSLVEKGVIEHADAQAILKDVQATAARQHDQMVRDTAVALQKDAPQLFDIPSWIERTTLTGDLRLRYDLRDRKGLDDRHRARYRLRVGIISEITDRINVGFGLISGDRIPRTGFQTAGGSIDSPDIRLDYAYASYAPFDWLTLIGGKMVNPVWTVSDWLWDVNIRPEGVAAKVSYDLDPMLNVFFNAGFFIIEHWAESEGRVRRAKQDPFIYLLQPGFDIKPIDDVYIKGAFTYYGFGNVRKNFTGLLSSGSNTRWGNSRWYNDDYDAVTASLEIGFCNLIEGIPFAAVYGDFINNITKSSNNKGFIFGAKVGEKSFFKRGQWQIEANWRRLDQNAWLDFLPDICAYGGQTAIRGWQIKTSYGFFDNVFGSLTYYSLEKNRGRKMHENHFLADIHFRF